MWSEDKFRESLPSTNSQQIYEIQSQVLVDNRYHCNKETTATLRVSKSFLKRTLLRIELSEIIRVGLGSYIIYVMLEFW